MTRKNIVVIGASAGGVEACKEIISELPDNFSGSVLIVIHVPRIGISYLPEILSDWGRNHIPVRHPRDGEPIKPGHVYVAPPDYHMLIDGGSVHLVAGPEENYSRPAINPLFRSAAEAYGDRVIGVILSGALDDGTAGLRKIKEYGGATVVQDPNDAVFPGMPESAIAKAQVDYVLPLNRIASLLTDLAEAERSVDIETGGSELKPEEIGQEKDILEVTLSELHARMKTGETTTFTCP